MEIELVCILPDLWSIRRKVDSYEEYKNDHFRYCTTYPPTKSEYLERHPEFRYWYYDFDDKEFKKYASNEYIRKYCASTHKWKVRRVFHKLVRKLAQEAALARPIEVNVCESFSTGSD